MFVLTVPPIQLQMTLSQTKGRTSPSRMMRVEQKLQTIRRTNLSLNLREHMVPSTTAISIRLTMRLLEAELPLSLPAED